MGILSGFLLFGFGLENPTTKFNRHFRATSNHVNELTCSTTFKPFIVMHMNISTS